MDVVMITWPSNDWERNSTTSLEVSAQEGNCLAINCQSHAMDRNSLNLLCFISLSPSLSILDSSPPW